jgi:4a-hydroxytetrahydrobiopterin dehydratase
MDLNTKKCKPCEGGIPPLSQKEVSEYLSMLGNNWEVTADKKITKSYSFVNFRHTMDFVNKVAALAEDEGHHPDMHVSYGNLTIELWTYAINGLSENDFIMAAKIDAI